MTLALQVWLVVGCLYWILASIFAARTLGAIPTLASLSPPEPPRWPRLSVIVPARDEAATLEAAMASKLAETYPELEIVLVDDRSTDGTGAIVDRLAAADPRVRALHVSELPAGWLGKLHAMQQGMNAATGELILFTDADVHFVPGALARAVAHLEARGVEHLALLPSFQGASFLVDTVICVTTRMIATGARAWAVEDPRSSAYLGVGAFNLVRRAALERTAGLEWLRLEVADDLGLGLLLKTHGARTCLVNGRGLVSVVWYPTLAGYARGAARASFAAIGGFSAARLFAWGLGALLLEAAPFCALALGGAPWLQLLGAATSALSLAVAVTVARWVDLPTGAALALPLGIVLQFGIAVRAAVVGGLRRGIEWRDTFYPSSVLRAGRRVRLP